MPDVRLVLQPVTVLSGGQRRPLGVLPLLVLALLAALPGPARAQDNGKGKGEKKQEESAKKSEEQVLFEAIATEWKAGNAAAVAARFPANRKVSLRLPDVEAGDYRAEQARSLLEKYFGGRTFSKVTLKSSREMTGTFEVEYSRAADRKRVKAELLLVLGVEEKRRVLVSARESP